MNKLLIACMLTVPFASAQMRVLTEPSKSPVVTIRIVFTAGSAEDPAGKPGAAYMTAMMLAGGGTKQMTYKQLVDAMFPMATTVHAQVDKEMTSFSTETHVDNLDALYKLLHAMLLEPGWREDDFKRIKDDAINFLKVGLRGNNDEELAKEELYRIVYAGTTYGHYSVGTVSSLEKMTLDDLKQFYKDRYTQSNMMLAIAGDYKSEFLERVKKDFRATLPAGAAFPVRLKPPKPIDHSRATIIEKETRSVAYSIGYPINVKRSDPDYPALLVAQAYLGQHRMGGRLFERMREVRGLNYGDYAYIEYFPHGMFLFEPPPNLARKEQIFQIWIRPVEPATAVFALRLAMWELNHFVHDGLSQEDFDRTRNFLSKYVNVLTKTKRAELGYMLDSLYYGMPDYNAYIKDALAKMTREQVNGAIKRCLRADRVQIVAVSDDAAELKRKLTTGEPSPITYNSPKPAQIMEEDKIVQSWDLGLRPEDVSIVPVDTVFQ